MFSLRWASSTTTKTHGSPANATNQQQHVGNNRFSARDIEAAVSLGSTQPSASSANRSYLQNESTDPLHRRSSIIVGNNNHSNSPNDESTEVPRSTVLPDALSSNIRSGNFTATDVSEAKATTSKTMRVSTKVQTVVSDPKLLHPILLRIPLHIRFALNGLICNILFMVAYNNAAIKFEHRIAVSTIYSIVYFIFIPLGHAFASLLVFGWPERYVASLLSNFPIGLTAIMIGSVLTGYLDSIHFSDVVDDFIRDNFTFSKMPSRANEDGRNEESQFWSSLVVLFVTSLWTYVLSIYINTIPTKSDKKEL